MTSQHKVMRARRFDGLFSEASPHWSTDADVYRDLHEEFHFDDDPCPLKPLTDGLARPWGQSTFLNPPYGREITLWIAKAFAEGQAGKTVVCLIPSRTDTAWWHEYVMRASEIRFCRGRLKFGGATWNAPFPSAIVVFRGTE